VSFACRQRRFWNIGSVWNTNMVEGHKPKVDMIPLGQAGFRLSLGSLCVYIDPYLSDSVEKIEGDRYRRLVPPWKFPDSVTDADWVLITHIHLDHCDPETLIPLSRASADCRFVGPGEVCRYLAGQGIPEERLVEAPAQWMDLNTDVRVHAVPAAHPEVETDAHGAWKYVGYVLEYGGRRIYHSGDTSLVHQVIQSVKKFTPIDVAILPVNEHNFLRENLGIVGNMSVRDAFGLAEMIGVKTLVPMHWDMFEPNTVYREEIELFNRLARPPFEVKLNPSSI
jgi:L-ascorbate 6-phosphate lactonase